MYTKQPIARRRFLQTVAAGLAASMVGSRPAALRAAIAPGNSRLTPADLKARLKGPILSIPTPFTSDFSIDFQGVRNMIKRALEHGVKIFSLTGGNSQYHAMTYEEIKELTRVAAEAVADKGVFIAATGSWWTGQAVDYARYAESVGADGVQIMLPGRTDQAGMMTHFKTIAQSTSLGLVLHGN